MGLAPSRARSARRLSSVVMETVEPRQLLTAVVTYDMGGNVNGREATEPAASVSAGLTPSDFARGSGLFAPTWANNPNSLVGSPTSNTWATSESAAASSNQYFTWTVTPASGKTLTVNSVEFAMSSQSTTPATYAALEYKVGSGAFSTAWSGVNTNAQTAPAKRLVTISSLSNVTAPVQFRLVMWGSQSYTINVIGNMSGPDVSVNGAVGNVIQPPAAPTGLAASSTLRSVGNKLTWVDNATDEDGYIVESSLSSTFTSVTSTALPANTTTWTDTTQPVGTTVYYRVLATKYSVGPSAPTAAVNIITMEKLNPVSYSIAGQGIQYDDVATGWMGGYPDMTTAEIGAWFDQAPTATKAYIMDVEDNSWNPQRVDAMNFLKAKYPGKWVGDYGVPTAPWYQYQDTQYMNDADAQTAGIRNAANILVPSLYLLSEGNDQGDSPAKFARDTDWATTLITRMKTLYPGKPIMPYLNYTNFLTDNMSPLGNVSIARWENLLHAIRNAGAETVCLWSGGGPTTPLSVWQPYIDSANAIFNS